MAYYVINASIFPRDMLEIMCLIGYLNIIFLQSLDISYSQAALPHDHHHHNTPSPVPSPEENHDTHWIGVCVRPTASVCFLEKKNHLTFFIIKDEGKVRLKEAMKAQRGSGSIALLFL
jgi:hypothetical protein